MKTPPAPVVWAVFDRNPQGTRHLPEADFTGVMSGEAVRECTRGARASVAFNPVANN